MGSPWRWEWARTVSTGGLESWAGAWIWHLVVTGSSSRQGIKKSWGRLRRQLEDVTVERGILRRAAGIFSQERSEVLRPIKGRQQEYPIGKMCKVFKTGRDGHYRSGGHVPSARGGEGRMSLSETRRICQRGRPTYGSPRVTGELRAKGPKVSRPGVARSMERHGTKAARKKKFVATTGPEHKCPVADNVLDGGFKAPAAAREWGSDITYLRTAQGWPHLTVVMGLFDRKVIGRPLSGGLKAGRTTIAAWGMAVKGRMPCKGTIFHSDRGVQYACHSFVDILESYQVTPSMSGKGNCWDNAVAGSFFGTTKAGLMTDNKLIPERGPQVKVFGHIETWYNGYRRHSALGYKDIIGFEKLCRIKNVAQFFVPYFVAYPNMICHPS